MWLKVDTHPNGCICCQTVTGPFVVASLPSFNIATVEGPLVVDAQLVFCAPTEQRQGCLGEAIRAIDYVAPDEMALAQAEKRDLLNKIDELEGDLARAHSDKVVSVPELLKFLGEDATGVTDAAAA